MKIAVVIPYWCPDQKLKDLLKRCLDSIDPRFEVIPWEDEWHEGVSATRNWGIEAALQWGAEWITFLDADDYMLPGAYDNMVSAIKSNRKAQIIQFNHKRRNPDGTVWTKFFNTDRVFAVPELPSFWVGVWNKVYKADLFENIRFEPGLHHGEDEFFNLRCIQKARKIHCSSMFTVMHCFDNPNSLSKSATVFDLADEQNWLLEVAKDCRDDKAMLQVIRERQVELWDNPTYRAIFGKDDTK